MHEQTKRLRLFARVAAAVISLGGGLITGFGHFAERAEVDGLFYFDTSLNGKGTKYPDPKSKTLFSEDNYVLLTFNRSRKSMTCDLKSLDGKVLDRTEVQGK